MVVRCGAAHHPRTPGLQVTHEDVATAANRTGSQVGGVGRERDVAAVPADHGLEALAVARAAVKSLAD